MIDFNKYFIPTPTVISTNLATEETTSRKNINDQNIKRRRYQTISTPKLTNENKNFLKNIGLLK